MNNPSMRIANHGYKAQSAMEYLMTYGWAILIIAVVLVAKYQMPDKTTHCTRHHIKYDR